MNIHKNYARLNEADRDAVDQAHAAAVAVLRGLNRKCSNTDPAEHLAEALATFLIDSGGAARVAPQPSGPFARDAPPYDNLTAPIGEEHESYNA